MTISSLASHASDARYWSPEQMLEKFLADLKAGKHGEVKKACIVFTADDTVSYYVAGTHNRLELLGMLSLMMSAIAVMKAEPDVA